MVLDLAGCQQDRRERTTGGGVCCCVCPALAVCGVQLARQGFYSTRVAAITEDREWFRRVAGPRCCPFSPCTLPSLSILQLIEPPWHLRLLRHAEPTAPAHTWFLIRVVYAQGDRQCQRPLPPPASAHPVPPCARWGTRSGMPFSPCATTSLLPPCR